MSKETTDERDNLLQKLTKLIEAGVDPVDQEKEIWQQYGEAVAVLILDSSGFTRISKSHGIVHFISRMISMRELIKPLFADANCISIKFEADNAFGIFKSTDDAINCALKVHQALYDAKLFVTDEERYAVCIGVGYGNMLHSESLEGYFSEEMNLASRLGEDTANSGETLITESAHKHASTLNQDKFTATTNADIDGAYYLNLFQPQG